MGKSKEYNNGEVTVLWKPDLCVHSGVCVKGLPEVFQPKERPWIKVDNATSEAIVNQVHQCPTGALSMKAEENQRDDSNNRSTSNQIEVNVIENGPLMVMASMKITKADGSTEIKDKQAAFCRCGASNNKPYCDGTHNESDFKG